MNPVSQRFSKDTAWYWGGGGESSVEPKADRKTIIADKQTSRMLIEVEKTLRTLWVSFQPEK